MEIKELLKKTIICENKLYNEDKKFINCLKKLSEISDKNFLNFLWIKRKNGISLARLNKYCYIYQMYLKQYELHTITENIMDLIFIKISNSEKATETKRTDLIITKQILKYFKLHKKIDFEEYKIKEKKKLILNNDLLTEDEKHLIISQIKNLKHKVFFTILFDTGLRVGEVYSVNKKSFTKTKKGYLVTIQLSKTKIRTVFTYSHNDLIEKLLKSKWIEWDFGYRTTYNIIKRFEKKLNKKLYHHLARHTKATELSSKLTEQELKNYMGWTPDSKMLNNYIHLNNKDVLNKLEALV